MAKSFLKPFLLILIFVSLVLIRVKNGASISKTSTESFKNFATNQQVSLSTHRRANEKKTISKEEAKEYLKRYGYWKTHQENALSTKPASGEEEIANLSSDQEEDALIDSIKEFQKLRGLSPTGELDVETIETMSRPRCGISDHPNSLFNPGKWHSPTLKYKITGYTNDMYKAEVQAAMKHAFKKFSEVIPLDFEESDDSAHIDVKFATGNHGHSNPFDGQGGVLAHASYPIAKYHFIHFDDDENWAYYEESAITSKQADDFLQVAMHEIGHAVGLTHRNDKESIMYPDYVTPNYVNGNYILPQLSSSDIEAVQKIYGKRYYSNTNENDNDGESNNNEEFYHGYLPSDYDPPPNECPFGRYYCPDDMVCTDKNDYGLYQRCYKQWTNCHDGGWCPGIAQCFDSDNDGVTDKCTNKFKTCPDGSWCHGENSKCYEENGKTYCASVYTECSETKFCLGRRICASQGNGEYNCLKY